MTLVSKTSPPELALSAPAASSETPALTPREIECPRCGTVAIGRDFCVCGEYLAWESTPAQEAQPVPEFTATLSGAAAVDSPPPAYRTPAPPENSPTLLTLRDPARPDDSGGAAVSVSVLPGTAVTVLATVRNQGTIVDQFDLRVEGLPDAWWSLSAETVYLNPWGSAGDCEQTVQVHLHPPMVSEAEARAWPLTVVARSRSLGTDAAAEPVALTILPYRSTVMDVRPERRRGRRRADFDVTVANHGNCPALIDVGAQDNAARCPIAVTPKRMTLPVGATASMTVRAGAPHPLFFSRPLDHQLMVWHRADGVDAEQHPARVTFQQRAWLAWWMPPGFALLVAFLIMLVMLQRPQLAPLLTSRTVPNAAKLLRTHRFGGMFGIGGQHLRFGRVSYQPAPPGVEAGSILTQVPPAGAETMRDTVDIVVAKAPVMKTVPAVRGRTLGAAAKALHIEGLGNSAQPSDAGDDWVVIRQEPAPGGKLTSGGKVTLAAAQPSPTPTPAPKPTSTPTPAPKPAPTPKPEPKPPASAKPAAAGASPAKAQAVTPLPAVPADYVFADAISGQLYVRANKAAQATRLTSPKYRLVTPTKTDDGYVAVAVAGADRGLMAISADGKTVTPIAPGSYRRPAYSPARGLLAVISRHGRGGPADAGDLCAVDPQGDVPLACIPAHARRVGRPSWSPDGRRVLVLAAGAHGGYNRLLSITARGGDATRWGTPTTVYRSADIQSAVWVGDDRIAALVADHPGAAAHLRLLARDTNGTFGTVKDFPTLTGTELAGSGHFLALGRGRNATADGAIVLLDVNQSRPRLRNLSNGMNLAWAK